MMEMCVPGGPLIKTTRDLAPYFRQKHQTLCCPKEEMWMRIYPRESALPIAHQKPSPPPAVKEKCQSNKAMRSVEKLGYDTDYLLKSNADQFLNWFDVCFEKFALNAFYHYAVKNNVWTRCVAVQLTYDVNMASSMSLFGLSRFISLTSVTKTFVNPARSVSTSGWRLVDQQGQGSQLITVDEKLRPK
ncbi:NADH dehydrogenase [Triplophysa rosa]|uniref:NADH dehydrogenase n=1 Tax=Triplophysa rosa TaxID=992332 RepID=A0A9W7X1V0_TRIRA|nr:NADH dehydrogenase [Triplophysa rosa]